MKHLMNKGDGNRSFADGGRHPLDVAAAHVANREDSGTIRFQQIGRPRQWPSACRQVRFDDEYIQPFRCAVHGGRESCGAGAHDESRGRTFDQSRR